MRGSHVIANVARALFEERVYPHVCGAANSPKASPLTCSDRSIPTCAGQPSCSQKSITRAACILGLSPRVRGSRAGRGPDARQTRGLSPRVRGSRQSTSSALRHLALPRVYPHVCGAARDMPRSRATTVHSGLSPRVRGSPLF